MEYAKEHGIPVVATKKKPWSVDENIWSRSIEGGKLEDPSFVPPEEIYEWTTDPVKSPDKDFIVLRKNGPAVATAHHSTAEFDYTKQLTIQGKVKEVQWTNPHSYIQLLVTGDNGKQVEWSVEIGERFQHVTRDVERIEPRLEIRSSGEQWFDLSYELAATGGERFSAGSIFFASWAARLIPSP